MRLSVFSVSVAAVASASLSVLVSATGVHPQDATGSFSLAHVGITIAAAVVGYVVLTKFMSSSKSAEVEPARKGNFKEVDAGDVRTYTRGSMREIEVPGEKQKILVTRLLEGNVFATGAKCTHYGANLVKGVVSEDRVVCPWHAASFCVRNGEVEDAPAFDGLHTFELDIVDEHIIVHVPDPMPPLKKARACKCGDNSSPETVVVVGAGAAGISAVETLREEKFDGKIILIGKEKHLPYDRVKISKSLKASVESMTLRPKSFFDEIGVELMLGTTVTNLNADKKTLSTDTNETIKYDKLLLCTGGTAEVPWMTSVPGYHQNGIYTLRVPEDATGVDEEIEKFGADKVRVVVVGSSFIGMEAAAYFRQSAKIDDVTVVGKEGVAFERVLGIEIGKSLMGLHEEKGVKFEMNVGVTGFEGKDGHVTGVKLDNGKILPADIVVVGAGIVIPSSYVKGNDGIEMYRDGSILCDEHMYAGKDVYVAGDMARFKLWLVDHQTRIEHWDVAIQQGKIAARNIAGKKAAYRSTPFFWTAQYGKSIRYCGHALEWTEQIVKGSLKERKFAVYFVNKDKVAAVCTLDMDPVAVAAAELLRVRAMPHPDEIRKTDFNIIQQLC